MHDPLSSKTLPPMPTAPTEAEWARLSPVEQDRLEDELLSALYNAERAYLDTLTLEERIDCGESEEHMDAKIEARDTLRLFFGRIGKSIYVAAEVPVAYPGEPLFHPDLIAVRDTVQAKRKNWMVSREGKGVDLCMEVLNLGDRRKDLQDNLEKYARLGIREYFVFDVQGARLHAFHLSTSTARRYTPILGNVGRYRSDVLELDLSVVEGRLRFYMGTAELSTKDEGAGQAGPTGAGGAVPRRASAVPHRAGAVPRRAGLRATGPGDPDPGPVARAGPA